MATRYEPRIKISRRRLRLYGLVTPLVGARKPPHGIVLKDAPRSEWVYVGILIGTRWGHMQVLWRRVGY